MRWDLQLTYPTPSNTICKMIEVVGDEVIDKENRQAKNFYFNMLKFYIVFYINLKKSPKIITKVERKSTTFKRNMTLYIFIKKECLGHF
jgi:hypothetical protein